MNKKQYERLIEEMTPAVRQAFIVSVQKFATSVPIKELEAAIANKNTQRLFDLLSYDRGDFSLFDRAIADAMAKGGDASATYVANVAKAQGLNTVRGSFDATNPVATAWMRERSSALIVEIVEQQREVIREALTAATETGRSVRSVGRDLVGTVNRATGRREGGVLGLTSHQASYADNALVELTSGDPALMRNYLDRKLRDRRFDGLVHNAISDGKPVSGAKAEQMVRNYRNGLLRRRGETVARTETIAALNEAKTEALDKLVADGIVRDQDIEREWDASSDGDTRDSHRAMDGDKQKKGDPFTSGDGNHMLFPGDRSFGAPAEDIINCRCYVRDRIDFIAAAQAGYG